MVSPREIAGSYWKAECSRDVVAVMRHFHDHATFQAPGWYLEGRKQVRRYYEESARAFPELEVEVLDDITDGERAAIEWSAVLVDVDGGRHPLAGVNLVRVLDGRFIAVRVYFDSPGVRECQ